MFGTLAKMVSYVKAPLKTFIVLHPVRTLKFGAAYWVGSMLFRKRKEDRPRPQEG